MNSNDRERACGREQQDKKKAMSSRVIPMCYIASRVNASRVVYTFFNHILTHD